MKGRTFRYGISLPETLNLDCYFDIPRKGISYGTSKAQAVAHYLMRNSPKSGRLIMHVLKQSYGGLEKFAEKDVSREEQLLF